MTAVLALKSLEVEYFVMAALETYYITRKELISGYCMSYY